MNDLKSFKDRLNTVDESRFDAFAVELFHFQASYNPVYKAFLSALSFSHREVKDLEDIPFLPISAFKHQKVQTLNWKEKYIFESSGITGSQPSRHYIEDLGFYENVSADIFKRFHGSPDQYHILALLPSYLERGASSLVHMVQHLIKLSQSEHSGFYLYNMADMYEKITLLQERGERRIMLWGVTYALIDFAESYRPDLNNGIVIETGGMKGRKEEMVREKVHALLKDGLSLRTVHSEYGMTELLSQAYAVGGGLFHCPPWMRVLTREINDPFTMADPGDQGVINVIDLANSHSCAFIATEDLGRVHADGSFEVLGRLDNADMRGCNLLVS